VDRGTDVDAVSLRCGSERANRKGEAVSLPVDLPKLTSYSGCLSTRQRLRWFGPARGSVSNMAPQQEASGQTQN